MRYMQVCYTHTHRDWSIYLFIRYYPKSKAELLNTNLSSHKTRTAKLLCNLICWKCLAKCRRTVPPKKLIHENWLSLTAHVSNRNMSGPKHFDQSTRSSSCTGNSPRNHWGQRSTHDGTDPNSSPPIRIHKCISINSNQSTCWHVFKREVWKVNQSYSNPLIYPDLVPALKCNV